MSLKKGIPLIPIPDFEKRLVDEHEYKELCAKTLPADPLTGKSLQPVKYTYADIVKGFGLSEPSEIYKPSEEEIARFKSINPFVNITESGYHERHPEQKEDDSETEFKLPEPSELFHKLNQSKFYE